MGKRTKKTRWRTLSIGDNASDTESAPGDVHPQKRHFSRINSAPHPYTNGRYPSSHSTPTRPRWGTAPKRPDTSTRSSSATSDRKITFNEDEYTKITTPRQDVLFKKGYLSRPRPHLQAPPKPLTSAGTSTGDGTPDHSADGAECNDGDYDPSPFLFPAPGFLEAANGGGASNVFFVNGFDPYTMAPGHVIVYDQYGNGTLCFPHALPHGPAPPVPFEDSRRVKRYSTDSMTESTSPNNESTQDADELFSNNPDEEDEHEEEIEEKEQLTAGVTNELVETSDENRLRRKRRRRKLSPSDGIRSSSASVSSLTDEEKNQEEEEEEEEKQQTPVAVKYRVDAQEFVPRAFRAPQLEFVPMPVPEMFTGPFVPAAMFVPHMAPFYPQIHAFPTVQRNTDTVSVNVSESPPLPPPPPDEQPCDTNEPKDSTKSGFSGVDIAKIVSKLEQAALEQKQLEDQDDIVIQVVEQEENVQKSTCKREREPLQTISNTIHQHKTDGSANGETKRDISSSPKYSERLKASQQPTTTTPLLPPALLPPPPPTTRRPQRVHPKPPPTAATTLRPRPTATAPAPAPPTCPRFDRSARQQPTPAIRTKLPPPVATPDQWISVSGKKKRNKNKRDDESINAQQTEEQHEQQQQLDEIKVTERISPSKEEIIIAKQQQQPVLNDNSVVNVVETPVKVKSASVKKTNVRKRIMVTDGPMVTDVQVPVTEQQKKEQQKQPQIVVVVKPVIPEVTSTSVKNPSKKKKKNKSKNNPAVVAIESTNDPAGGSEPLSAIPLPPSPPPDAPDGPTDLDVSAELDRMIQRGLYANLEQRLLSFNPSDSFIVDVLRPQAPPGDFLNVAPAPFAPLKRFDGARAVIGPLKSSAIAMKKKSEQCDVIIDIVKEVDVGPQLEEHQQEENVVEAVQTLLPITRAVREWMDRTRESTPEVEIFKRPNEIRKEFMGLPQVDDLDDDEEDHDVTDETIACDDSSDKSRSRDASVGPDLLECWETDVCLLGVSAAPQPPPEEQAPIEQAQDALESYESVYGRSEDFSRIQREVLQQQQRQRYARGDGGLPYRAICCTVM